MSQLFSDGTSSPRYPVLAHVVHSLNPGGAEKLVVEMSSALSENFEVQVFCLDEPGLWATELRARGIFVHCLWRQPGLDLSLIFKLARALRSCGAQIVHAHQCTPWFYAALARLLYPQCRLLLEEHGRFFPEVDRPMRRLVNSLLIQRLTERIVAVSEDIRKRLMRYEGLTRARIEVIYNGVSRQPMLSSSERDAKRLELGFSRDAFVVGTVGRFDPIKNLPMLVRSLAAAQERDRRIRGLLVGDGPDVPVVQKVIDDLGLTDTVRLAGYRADARTLVQCMDLFVLSSLSEGTSMALLEAMAGAVPAAVTDAGGNPELVRSGETGWVVASGSTEALTAALIEASNDPGLRNRFGQAGFRRFETYFTFEGMMASYQQLYQALMPTAVRRPA